MKELCFFLTLILFEQAKFSELKIRENFGVLHQVSQLEIYDLKLNPLKPDLFPLQFRANISFANHSFSILFSLGNRNEQLKSLPSATNSFSRSYDSITICLNNIDESFNSNGESMLFLHQNAYHRVKQQLQTVFESNNLSNYADVFGIDMSIRIFEKIYARVSWDLQTRSYLARISELPIKKSALGKLFPKMGNFLKI